MEYRHTDCPRISSVLQGPSENLEEVILAEYYFFFHLQVQMYCRKVYLRQGNTRSTVGLFRKREEALLMRLNAGNPSTPEAPLRDMLPFRSLTSTLLTSFPRAEDVMWHFYHLSPRVRESKVNFLEIIRCVINHITFSTQNPPAMHNEISS